MLTIENVHKIVGKKIPIQTSNWIARIKDVYYMIDNTYVFEVETNSTNYINQKKINIILDCKIYSVGYTKEKHWELSWEMYKPANPYETHMVKQPI